MRTSLGQLMSPGCWGKGWALLLTFCREWWLLLLPDNSTTTFLMLTGLHIHLSSLGDLLGHFFKSSFQGHHLQSQQNILPVVKCNCSQMCIIWTPPCSQLLWCKQSLQLHKKTASVHYLQQPNPTTTAPLLHSHETSPAVWKMKNEWISYDFTHSCQKDINRIQLQRRLDIEILLFAVNRRPALSRRAVLMCCYEGERMEEEGRPTFTL